MASRAFITGLSGTGLTAEERGFLRETAPWALILFRRNIDNPDQVLRLVAESREALGWECPVLVDQEGGRVQRFGPPHWPAYPPGVVYGRLYRLDRSSGVAAARLGGLLIGSDLRGLGVDTDCAPLADLPVPGADQVIGDRAYGDTVEEVATLAGAFAEGLTQAGVLPVLKHLPGHGRANADSHLALPRVEVSRATLDATDFAAFRPLAHLPLGMTAHVVYSAIDPEAPATLSHRIVQHVIRESLGFHGLLMSDDVSMGALTGTLAARSAAALAAGCDLVLHCNGKLDEMREVAGASPILSGAAARRAAAALAQRGRPADIDLADARRQFATLMQQAGPAS